MTDKTDSMVERVARATYDATVIDLHSPFWEDVSKPVKKIFRKRATAAIKAMQEPTEAMVEAGKQQGGFPTLFGNTWKAALTAALEEPAEGAEIKMPEITEAQRVCDAAAQSALEDQ